MKLKYILLSSLMLLSGCKDPKYGDLYVKDNINLYMREDKTFYLEKDNEKFRGTYENKLMFHCGVCDPYENEYFLTFDKEEIYLYNLMFSIIYIDDVLNYIEFDEPEYWTDRCVELLDEIFNKEMRQVKENLKIKNEFDFIYYFSSLVAIENFTIDINLRIYSKNEEECKKLFDYYIDTIKTRFINDDLIGELTENVDFYNTSYENMEPTLTNNEIWFKLENDTFTYKGVL